MQVLILLVIRGNGWFIQIFSLMLLKYSLSACLLNLHNSQKLCGWRSLEDGASTLYAPLRPPPSLHLPYSFQHFQRFFCRSTFFLLSKTASSRRPPCNIRQDILRDPFNQVSSKKWPCEKPGGLEGNSAATSA